jgi:hypothetical protein
LEKVIEAIELFVKFTINVVQTPNWGQNAKVGLKILHKVFYGAQNRIFYSKLRPLEFGLEFGVPITNLLCVHFINLYFHLYFGEALAMRAHFPM